MATVIEETGSVETNTIGVFRTAATVKGGRRFSFGSLVVAGDRQGRVGLGYGKANEVPPAIEKGGKEAKKSLRAVKLQGNTIPHTVIGRCSSSVVKLIPASPGTGVVAGSTVRAVLEMAGVTDCMTKSYGSNNKQNLAKAVLDGLLKLRAKDDIAQLRGVSIGKTEVDERIERASAFVTEAAPTKSEDGQDQEIQGDKTSVGSGGGVETTRSDEKQPKGEATAEKPEGAQDEQKPGEAQGEDKDKNAG